MTGVTTRKQDSQEWKDLPWTTKANNEIGAESRPFFLALWDTCLKLLFHHTSGRDGRDPLGNQDIL